MHYSHIILNRKREAGDVVEKTDRKEQLHATALQERYLRDVFEYVARRISDREEAEDITAEVFAAAFSALPRFRHECSPRVWLLGIARRRIVNSLRRGKHRPSSLSQFHDTADELAGLLEANAPQSDGPSTTLERYEARQAIRQILEGLKEDQREALLLKYVEGLSMREIALVMKRSPQAVNSLLQRARKTAYERGKAYFLDDEVNP